MENHSPYDQGAGLQVIHDNAGLQFDPSGPRGKYIEPTPASTVSQSQSRFSAATGEEVEESPAAIMRIPRIETRTREKLPDTPMPTGMRGGEGQGGIKKRQLRRSEVWLGGLLVLAVVSLILVASVLGERLATARCGDTGREAITNSSTSIPALGITTVPTSTTTASTSISKISATVTTSSSSLPTIKATSSTSTSTSTSSTSIVASSTAIPTSNAGTLNLVLPSTGVLQSPCSNNEYNSFISISTSYSSSGYQSTFNSSCNIDYVGQTTVTLTTYTYQQCIDACNSVNAVNSACIAISWVADLSTVVKLQGGNCYLKNRTDSPVMFDDAGGFGGPQIGAVLLFSGAD